MAAVSTVLIGSSTFFRRWIRVQLADSEFVVVAEAPCSVTVVKVPPAQKLVQLIPGVTIRTAVFPHALANEEGPAVE